MKILVLQLARFGDIYMTWPMIRALKRLYPQGEIHILVRKRFSEALVGLDSLDKVIELPTQEWAKSLIDEASQDSTDFSQSVTLLDQFLEHLKAEKYDKVVNTSFSPVSSYLTHAIARNGVEAFGYSRFSDGSFQCSDSISSYFYDQVGEDRSNRYHVTDLLAAMVDVDLIDADFTATVPNFNYPHTCHPQRTLLVHVGASQKKKALAGFQWGRIIKSFLQMAPEFEIALIGSPDESYLAEEIQAHNPDTKIVSYVGKTKVSEVFDLLKNSHSLMACDSMALHMADLTQTPCFNLSFKSVNFWETGPLAPGSVVYQAEAPEYVNTLEIAEKWVKFARGENIAGVFSVQKSLPRYHGLSSPEQDFQWQLMQALYTNESFPVAEEILFCECIEKVHQLNEIFIDSLKKIQKKSFTHAQMILNQTENTMMSVARFHPAIAVMLRWYRGKKIKVSPGSQSDIINDYLKIHLEFRSVLKVYLWNDNDLTSLKKD